MKPFYPLLLLFICAAIKTTAQDIKGLQLYSEAKWIAKFNTLSWLDPETPTLQPGIEYRLNKRSAIEFTVGIPTRLWDNTKNTDTTYNRYFKLKAELKYFPGERRSFYLAPEGTYISRQRSKFNGTFTGKDGEVYGYDYAELDKSIFAFAFKLGFVVPLSSNGRWVCDTWFGAGPRFMSENINATNRRSGGHGPMFWRSDREGFTTTIHLTAGLKVGYIIH